MKEKEMQGDEGVYEKVGEEVFRKAHNHTS